MIQRSFFRATLTLPLLLSPMLLAGCRQAPSGKSTAGQPGASSATAAAPEAPRTGTPLPDGGFKVEWISHDVPGTLAPGRATTVRITLKNAGTAPWLDRATASPSRDGAYAIRIGWRWWDPKDRSRPVLDLNPRTDFTRPIAPGASESIALEISTPTRPGNYVLQVDLVQEFVSWFADKGAKSLEVPVTIR